MGEAFPGKAFTAAYALMPNKKSGTYKALIQILKDNLNQLVVTAWSIDFESAVMKEIWSAFGGKSAIAIRGCYVHWRRNLRKRISDNSLVPVMNRHAGFQTWIKSLAALAFLPPEEIQGYYHDLIHYLPTVKAAIADDLQEEDEERKKAEMDSLDQNIESFLDSFEGTYIGRRLRAGGFSAPRFEAEIWSHFTSIINSTEMTNNWCENTNSVLSKSIPINASFWTVLDRIKDHEARQEFRFNELLAKSCQNQEQPNKRRSSEQFTELKNILQSRHQFGSRIDFLKRLSSFTKFEEI